MYEHVMMKGNWKRLVLAVLACLVLALPAVAGAKEKIVIGDLNWDSVQVHDRIVAFILEKGMGYDVELVPGSTSIIVESLIRGDVDIDMESWTENIQKQYDRGIESGNMLDLGSNYSDNWQGWLVPTYVVKGDAKRGIKATAPDLKTVEDMKKYWEIFKDPEDPSKGRFYNCVPGWLCAQINEKKFETYGLNKYYNIFMPGSDAALSGSMMAAYEKGEPWFGYYWGPTWVLGLLDMTPIQEPAYDEAVWEKNKGCAFPANQVNILVHKSLPERAPDAVAMLKKYDSDMALNNKILAYMKEEKTDPQGAAMWFLKTYEDIWTSWVSADVAAKVKAALK